MENLLFYAMIPYYKVMHYLLKFLKETNKETSLQNNISPSFLFAQLFDLFFTVYHSPNWYNYTAIVFCSLKPP